MPDASHCSKCCPVEPPEPEKVEPWPISAVLWLAAIIVTVGGLYFLAMMAVSGSL